jgi:UDPglucose 6-dehydrogenase
MEVSSAAVRANEVPTKTLIAHMEKDLGGLGDKLIAVWGLAFKPKTDDVREAPGIKMIAELVARGARVRTTDPQARETARESMTAMGLMDRVEILDSEYETCRGADALLLATEWNEYRNPEFPRVRELMRGRHVFDGRNMCVPSAVVAAGLAYRGMGRPILGY